MKTKTHKHKNDCLPCDIPPFTRNNYFTGKLLTERDFTAEQRYLIDKLRLHHIGLHGWGVICGLKVKPHPYCPDRRVVVEPGLAIDGCGREIRVPQEVELDLPTTEPTAVAIEDPCPPDEADESVEGASLARPTPAADEQQEEYKPTLNLYICLRYVEWQTEPMPAPFDECACGSNGTRPNRIQESYEIQVLTKEPDSFEQVRTEKEKWESDDSEDIYESLFAGCPEPSNIDCIPLALIRDFTPGEELKGESIHNRRCRRLLPSTTVLYRFIRYILGKIPSGNLTKIIEISWDHRREYHFHDFMRLFVGEHASSSGFEITFDRPVRKDGITIRTFQAIAVRYLDNTHSAGQPEVVPATVRLNHTRTKAHLHIDHNYARNRLERIRFDLYLLLRCNQVVDDRGNPVDGNLLAGLDRENREYLGAIFPTGDGIVGGTFESWIRVVHGETHEREAHESYA